MIDGLFQILILGEMKNEINLISLEVVLFKK